MRDAALQELTVYRTTELTTTFATFVANLIGLAKVEKGVEVVVRAVCFPILRVDDPLRYIFPAL